MPDGRATNDPSNYFAFGKQSAKDTEATTFIFTRHLDGTGYELDEQVESVREGGDGQEVGFVHKTAISADGDCIVNSRPVIGAALSAWTLGANNVAAGTAAATGVSQVITAIPTSSQPYLTVEQRWADKIERVSNVQVSGLTLEGEAGRPMKLSSNFVAGGTPWTRPVASALTPARESGQPHFYPGGSYVLTGATGAKMTKFKTEIRRNQDTDIRTTSLFREDVVGLNLDINFEATFKYEDEQLYNRVHYLASNGTIDPNAMGLATGAFSAYSEFGTGTSLRFFKQDLTMLAYTGARVNKLDPDGKTMYIDVSAIGVKGATHSAINQFSVPSGTVV